MVLRALADIRYTQRTLTEFEIPSPLSCFLSLPAAIAPTPKMVDESSSITIYPHTTLTWLHEPGHKPTRKQILLVQLELDANSSSVDSVLGNHGHVFLKLSIDFPDK